MDCRVSIKVRGVWWCKASGLSVRFIQREAFAGPLGTGWNTFPNVHGRYVGSTLLQNPAFPNISDYKYKFRWKNSEDLSTL